MALNEEVLKLKQKQFKDLYSIREGTIFSDTFIDSINLLKKECGIDESEMFHTINDNIYSLCGLLVEHRSEKIKEALKDILDFNDHDKNETLQREWSCIWDVCIAANKLLEHIKL